MPVAIAAAQAALMAADGGVFKPIRMHGSLLPQQACRGVELAGKLAAIAVAARGLRGDELESRVTCSAG